MAQLLNTLFMYQQFYVLGNSYEGLTVEFYYGINFNSFIIISI